MLLPLATWRRGGLRVLGWLGGDISDYPGPIISRRCPPALRGAGFRALWDRILSASPPADVVVLGRQLADLGGGANPLLTLPHTRHQADAHVAHLGPDWGRYYASRCSGRTRRRHRQKWNRMARAGAVSMAVLSDAAQRQEALQGFLDLKSAGYQALGVRDLFAEEGYRRFVRALCALPSGPLHFSTLRVGGSLWAGNLGLTHRGRLYLLFPAYRRTPAAAACSPGAALTRWLLQQGCESGLEAVDFTLGDEPFKARWCDTRLPVFQVTQPLTTRGRVMAGGLQAWGAIKRQLKQHPVLYPAVLRARARHSTTLGRLKR